MLNHTFEQHIELLFIKIEVMSKTLLHCVPPNNDMHYLGQSNVLFGHAALIFPFHMTQ